MPSSRRNLLASSGISSDEVAEAIDFDGTNDYLSRSSDLTGNADSKTFTFSCWYYPTSTVMMVYMVGAARVYMRQDTSIIRFWGYDATTTTAINVTIPITVASATDTWNHFLISVDLTDTGKRAIYFNDELMTPTWSTYANSAIDFTDPTHNIIKDGGAYDGGRLAHLFLDHDYLDLSVEANRRNFITADLHPATEATQSALSPILYLPMTGPGTPEVNAGTGGDFTLNGTIARSGRGPNQDNCVASDLDGSADWLTLASPSGTATGKQGTVSFVINSSTASLSQEAVYNCNNALYTDYSHDDQTLGVQFRDTATTGVAARVTLNNFNATGITTHVAVSVDVDGADTANRHVYVNGEIYTDVTWDNFADIAIGFTNTPWNIGAGSTGSPAASSYFEGAIGEVYIDDAYTDLSTTNPFWDSDLGKPVSVRQVIDDTGVTPLVACPLIGSDAGNNLGSVGDYTVNSGPFTGARGASEFWARSVDFDKSTDYYSRTSTLTGSSDGKVVNGFFAIRPASVAAGTENIFTIVNGSSERFAISRSATDILIEGWDSGGTQVLLATATATLAADTWAVIHFNFDLASSTNRSISKDGTNLSVTWTTFTNTAIELSASEQYIGSGDAGGNLYGGDLAIMWLDFGSEIDFTDEATRLIYSDALGFPTDLQAAIDAGTSPQGIVHMKFDDVDDFGANSGTGGDFTENGTPVAGADVGA